VRYNILSISHVDQCAAIVALHEVFALMLRLQATNFTDDLARHEAKNAGSPGVFHRAFNNRLWRGSQTTHRVEAMDHIAVNACSSPRCVLNDTGVGTRAGSLRPRLLHKEYAGLRRAGEQKNSRWRAALAQVAARWQAPCHDLLAPVGDWGTMSARGRSGRANPEVGLTRSRHEAGRDSSNETVWCVVPDQAQSIFRPRRLTTGVQSATSAASVCRNLSGFESRGASIPASINICL
jgi:hypothetical protein